jgi:glycosyltransferase involved in cell wall biosynthesis
LSAEIHLPSGPVEKEVIVVDDASTDRTVEMIGSDPRVKLVRHEKNQGKGAAIRAGLAHVTGDVVLIQDADMEYSVQDYPALLRPFIESGAEVVYGSRFLKRRWPTNMRWTNYLANRLFTLTANVLYGARITDEATCYKVFRAPLLKSLPLCATGFEFCPEVTALVRLRHIPIHEVPVEYKGRRHAEGKKVRWTDGIKALLTLLRYRIRRS